MGLTFTDAVLGWGVPRLRDLPWRHTRDPWAVLVSEVMLQQTQVLRVIPKYLAFIESFPTPAACASSSLGDVLRAWQGLGYPRRARDLHAAAARVAEVGAFPDTLDGLLALPGVGQYTARAVLAFAFETDVAVVDTNIARVLARVHGRRLAPKEVQRLADDVAPVGESWGWNQSIMDLGAVLCRPTSPSCGTCPVEPMCAWRGIGPDPALGSAGVSGRQAPFEGSDRQARGRLVRELGQRAVPVGEVPALIGRSPERSDVIVTGLLADGLCTIDDPGLLHLP